MEPRMITPLSNEELNRLVEESGWIDGEWHSAAAASPAGESYGPEGRYPCMVFLVEDTQISWADLTRDGKVVAMFAWCGDPVAYIDADWICLSTADDELQHYMDGLGRRGLTMDEARDHILEIWQHTEIRTGTLGEYNALYEERVKKLKKREH